MLHLSPDHRDFKFGTLTYHSKSHPADNQVWATFLSKQVLSAIKHIADDIHVCQHYMFCVFVSKATHNI